MGPERRNNTLLPRTARMWSIPLRITLIYAIVGGLWILFSDAALSILVEEPKTFLHLQTVKGWFFIGITASMLYLLIRRDLAAIRHSEEALEESERQYRLIVDNVPVGIYRTTVSGELLYANDEFRNLLEFESLNQLKAEDIIDRYENPEQRKIMIDILKEKGRIEDYEVALRSSNGKRLDVLLNVVLHGDILTGIALDITDRKRVEAALRENEERLRLLIDNITDYEIFMVNPEGYIMSWNMGAEVSKGYRPEEVIGKRHSIFFTTEDIRKGIPEEELRVAAAKGRYEDEGWRVKKDGGLFWADVVTNALRDKDGKLCGYVKVIRDITDRRIAEEKIRESEERYRIITETASDGIITIDEESTIILANDSAQKIFGYESGALLGEKLTRLMPERLRNKHLAGMQTYLDTGQRKLKWKALEMPGIHITGREMPLEISYGEVIKDGKHYFTGIVRDVSERKAAEKEREYQRTLEQLNREFETLVAERTMSLMALKVADRVRNPSSVIRWTTDRLFRKDGMPEKLREEIGVIAGEARKLDDIVRDFQEVLKKRKSMFVYEDANEVVRGIAAVTEREAAAKHVKIEVLLSQEPLRINIQKDLFRIALFNLGRNAIEAAPEGGTVTFSTSTEGEQAIISVSDTGPGIPKEIIGNIFDPFFSTKEYRFGMGLPLIKQIVSEHLGHVQVISEDGMGTTFRMSLPLRWKEQTE